jgi:hypothetical protein
MESIKIDASQRQLSRLRNGHKVRVKGNGVYTLIVNPHNYNSLTKSFKKNKASEIQLTPEEIQANKTSNTPPSSTIIGQGIFGKQFDKIVEQKIGKAPKQILYKTASTYLKPAAQAGLIAAATAVGASQPELIPFIAPALGIATDYIDNPSKYQTQTNNNKQTRLMKEYAKNKALEKVNEQMGTNMGNFSRATIEKAANDKLQQELYQQSLLKQQEMAKYGNGLYLGKSTGGNINMLSNNPNSSIVLTEGGVHLPKQNQQQFQNFQLNKTLPPRFQPQKTGNGLYL